MIKKILLTIAALTAMLYVRGQYYTVQDGGVPQLTQAGASHFARLAMKNIRREFPNKTQHVQRDATDLKQPSEYHPAFYGCFDWHSSVHGHWMLVKLLKEFPAMPEAGDIRKAIDGNITPENISAEVEYFVRDKSFERMYGWGWLLKLAEELHGWDDEQGRRWQAAIEPLARLIASYYIDFLPRLNFPTRTGVHTNTALGLSMALDYAIATGDEPLLEAVRSKSTIFFGKDRRGPVEWEPGGADFLSPCLIEAELMSKIMDRKAFGKWLTGFLPGLMKGRPANLFTPVTVSDRTDGQLVHLDGLNLSRAWCLLSMAGHAANSSQAAMLRHTAVRHLNAAVPNIADDNYEGEHWLATFAVYALFMR